MLSLSGIYLYVKMWWQRRALGRHGWFWSLKSEPLLWRRLHRYLALLAFLFLAYIAVTGTLLGAHILGDQASLLIQPLVQAMSSGMTVADMARGQPA